MAKRLKFVKLDTSGITKFQKTLGQKGQTFKVGIFDSENARKAYLLEVGDPTHYKRTPRKWISKIYDKNTAIRARIVKDVALFATNALQGKDTKHRTAENVELAVKDYLYNQEFSAPALTKKTIELKRKKGAVNPEGIGLDSLKMLKAIKVRPVGGKRKPNKKK